MDGKKKADVIKAAQPEDMRDRRLTDLRISVMDRCNHRCPYCMPESDYSDEYPFLDPSERLSFDEIIQVVKATARLGVNKVRITGGEPLLRPNLPKLIKRISDLPEIKDLALTTNGVLLTRQIKDLKEAGLKRITVSLDAIDDELFLKMNGGKSHVQQVLDGIKAAQDVGLESGIKINMVVQKGVNEHEVLKVAEYFRNQNIVVRFIEYMDVGTRNKWQRPNVVSSDELRERIDAKWKLEPLPSHKPGETATRYAYADGAGEVGFISAVSNPFCGECSRLRMSSEGKVYTCLFAQEGFDLRPILKGKGNGPETTLALENEIKKIWKGRDDHYSAEREEREALEREKGDPRYTETNPEDGLRRIEMNYIGG